MEAGTLYGVGVGPGDPELMTLKAVKTALACDLIAVPHKDAALMGPEGADRAVRVNAVGEEQGKEHALEIPAAHAEAHRILSQQTAGLREEAFQPRLEEGAGHPVRTLGRARGFLAAVPEGRSAPVVQVRSDFSAVASAHGFEHPEGRGARKHRVRAEKRQRETESISDGCQPEQPLYVPDSAVVAGVMSGKKTFFFRIKGKDDSEGGVLLCFHAVYFTPGEGVWAMPGGRRYGGTILAFSAFFAYRQKVTV